MENFMGGAVVTEATLASFLLALWITWLVLRGFFRLIPAVNRATARAQHFPNMAAKSGGL
jgi:hypothetical protein